MGQPRVENTRRARLPPAAGRGRIFGGASPSPGPYTNHLWQSLMLNLSHKQFTKNILPSVCSRTMRHAFSTMPTCQSCITEVAEVTDNDASIRSNNTTNQDVEKYF